MDEAKYTLPISLPEFETQYGILMAKTLLRIFPVAVLFFVMQQDFVAGLMTGAVKG